jgi:hypothetical protein
MTFKDIVRFVVKFTLYLLKRKVGGQERQKSNSSYTIVGEGFVL